MSKKTTTKNPPVGTTEAPKTKARTTSTVTAKIDPFKTKKSNDSKASADAVTPPADVQQAVDAFRDFQEQAKHFEGEATIQKDKIYEFATTEYAKRMLTGADGSFKILGEETVVTYVITDSSAGLSEENQEDFTKKYGEKAAEALITKDLGSLRFDAAVLEANYDAVVGALQTLPAEVLSKLFKPMSLKAVSGAAVVAKAFATTPEEYEAIVKDLKIKNYLK